MSFPKQQMHFCPADRFRQLRNFYWLKPLSEIDEGILHFEFLLLRVQWKQWNFGKNAQNLGGGERCTQILETLNNIYVGKYIKLREEEETFTAGFEGNENDIMVYNDQNMGNWGEEF